MKLNEPNKLNKSNKFAKTKKLIYNEKYHDNCHDYLKKFYLEKYAVSKYKNLLYEINKKIPKVNICTDTPLDLYSDVIVCDQHGVVFTKHNSLFPIVATYALNACVGLVMFVPEYKIGCLAHIDGLPGYSKKSAIEDGVKINFDPVEENIKIILSNLKKLVPINRQNQLLRIDFYLIGGIFDLSEVMVHDIIECINKFNGNTYKFRFRGRNLLGPENQSRNICLDTRNGRITYFDFVTNSEVYKNDRNADGLPKNIIKAPRISEAFLDLTREII